MFVPKRALGAFLFVFFVGTGVSVYLGVQLGLGAAPRDDGALVALAAARTPADVPSTTCPLPAATAADAGADAGAGAGAQTETNVEQGDFATNSGTIAHSQFNDGGFGDIGQQWWNVTVNGTVTNVHVSGGDATVTVNPDGQSVTPTTVTPVAVPGPPPAPVASEPPATTPSTSAPTPVPTTAPAGTPTTVATPPATLPPADQP